MHRLELTERRQLWIVEDLPRVLNRADGHVMRVEESSPVRGRFIFEDRLKAAFEIPAIADAQDIRGEARVRGPGQLFDRSTQTAEKAIVRTSNHDPAVGGF